MLGLSGDIVAFYSGYIISCKRPTRKLNPLDRRPISDEEFFLQNSYGLVLGVENLCIDMPPGVGMDIDKYNATLGHKANHSFEPNTFLQICWAHPVLGTINMLVASHGIPTGTELTLDYGYDTSKPAQPAWYREMWETYHAEKLAELKKTMPWIGVA